MHAIIEADLLAHLRGNQWLVQNGYIPKAHAVLCDPPYGLEFMGKEWDKPKPSGLMAERSPRDPRYSGTSKRPYLAAAVNQYVAGVDFQHWVTEWAELLLDYVYPGGLLMAFGGTRTYHRLAAGLEDAGWEITDCMMWVTGQGFPKSASIGKLLDKEAGAAREVVGIDAARFARLKNQLNGSVSTGEQWEHGPRDVSITAPATPLAARWEGYGTALKPAYEPVVIARAPRGKRTYAALAREFGTGALAIDAARIGTEDGRPLRVNTATGVWMGDGFPTGSRAIGTTNVGRWPANFGLVCACESDDHAADCPVRVLGEQSGETGNGYRANPSLAKPNDGDLFWKSDHVHGERGHNDTGTAARFFYQAKASGFERLAGLPARSTHPTTKPIKMGHYLATLLLPPPLDEPRRLLVPFAGSGSEMIGALLAGWDVVTGIEREAEYVELARARVGWWAQFSTYDDARKAYEQGRKTGGVDAPVKMSKPTFSTAGPLLRCPEHGASIPLGGNVYRCGCPMIYPGKREQPAPVVDEKPDTLPMFTPDALEG